MTIARPLIDECVHCGFCLPACPTYNSWNEEMDSPRGRIYLMKSLTEGKPLNDTVQQHFDRCLGCMACVTACPSGVKYDALIMQTRAEVEKAGNRSIADRLFRSMIFALFPHPKRLKAAVAMQLVYVRSGLRWLLRAVGLTRLLPHRLENLEALMPPVSAHHVTAKLPEFTAAQGVRRARVALLAGCVQRVYFPNVNEATIRVLSAEGCDVIVPPKLGCCGALSAHAGRHEEAQQFAREAIVELEHLEVDAIIVNAAGCGSFMKEWRHVMTHDAEWTGRAAAMTAKVKDITEFLAQL
ncbi:MAG TPA: heterodisulfide reductase-related iron-sulfur binding cluster, partial [Thermoanaerobaculia bacterium]